MREQLQRHFKRFKNALFINFRTKHLRADYSFHKPETISFYHDVCRGLGIANHPLANIYQQKYETVWVDDPVNYPKMDSLIVEHLPIPQDKLDQLKYGYTQAMAALLAIIKDNISNVVSNLYSNVAFVRCHYITNANIYYEQDKVYLAWHLYLFHVEVLINTQKTGHESHFLNLTGSVQAVSEHVGNLFQLKTIRIHSLHKDHEQFLADCFLRKHVKVTKDSTVLQPITDTQLTSGFRSLSKERANFPIKLDSELNGNFQLRVDANADNAEQAEVVWKRYTNYQKQLKQTELQAKLSKAQEEATRPFWDEQTAIVLLITSPIFIIAYPIYIIYRLVKKSNAKDLSTKYQAELENMELSYSTDKAKVLPKDFLKSEKDIRGTCHKNPAPSMTDHLMGRTLAREKDNPITACQSLNQDQSPTFPLTNTS